MCIRDRPRPTARRGSDSRVRYTGPPGCESTRQRGAGPACKAAKRPVKTLTVLRTATYDRGKRKGASLATADTMTSGIFELILNAGPVAKFVLGVLLLFSVCLLYTSPS